MTTTTDPMIRLTLKSISRMLHEAIEKRLSDKHLRSQMVMALTMFMSPKLQAWHMDDVLVAIHYGSALGWIRQGLGEQDIEKACQYAQLTVRDLDTQIEKLS